MAIPKNTYGAVRSGVAVVSSMSQSISSHSSSPPSELDIIDIRHDAVEISLKDDILSQLRPESGLKHLPTLLLYDERGLQLFEEITYLDEYYLTNAEIDVLERSAQSIAKEIRSGSMSDY